ncbi:MAG: SulP family inorganic anion transporter [Cyclobacteriaceae bacterium]|nr:SulP family inorganic anion transporter [Cyclobacteriaceae bacterium]
MFIRRLIPDITAGLTVSFAAISLGAAFGVMSGRGAFAGMISAAVIPIVTSLFGGTRIQASGPTAPMTAISALTIAFAYDQFPVKDLAEQFITLVFIINALILIIGGFAQISRLISLVPNVIILGFMNGIGVLIWYDQLIKVLALKGNQPMQGGVLLNLALALSTFLMIYLINKLVRQIPLRPSIRSLISGVLFSILIITVLIQVFKIQVEGVQLGTTSASFNEFFGMIANYWPAEIIRGEYIMMALPFSIQLALLAYLDSLLTALVMDKMTHEKSNLNKELIAQGLGNGLAAVVQGIPGAQATIRSVLLIKEGAQSRIAGVLLGFFALISLLLLKDWLALVPAAVFIGVLWKAGLDVSDKEFPKLYLANRWYTSPERNVQLALIVFTTLITVLVDLNIAVLSGTALFYIGKFFWEKVTDVEHDFQNVTTQKEALAEG